MQDNVMKIDNEWTARICRQIAEEVRTAPLQELPGWHAIKDYYQAQEMICTVFAIECSSGSVQVYTDGSFDTRAKVLVEFPTALSSGRESFGSQTFSGMAYGRIDPKGEIHVERFSFGEM
jgi:hypothetical protein